MTQRIITGTIYTAQDKPWVGAEVRFELARQSFTATIQYPRSTVRATTDSGGRFSCAVWISDEGLGTTQYRCRLPSGEMIDLAIPPGGSPIDIATLRSAQAVSHEPSVESRLLAIVEAHDSNPGSHPALLELVRSVREEIREIDRELLELLELLKGENQEAIDRLLKMIERLKKTSERLQHAGYS